MAQREGNRLHCADQAAEDGPRQKGEEAFAEAGAGRIEWCGDVLVVPADMLDTEVGVADTGHEHLGQGPFKATTPMHQLMGDVDRAGT
jgi:hypothetical protein